jgi:hypothetical protein
MPVYDTIPMFGGDINPPINISALCSERGFMKKCICVLVLVLILSACGTERKILPIPEFPLDEAGIVAAVQELGLPWTVVEHFVDPNNEMPNIYGLYKDGGIIAAITSGMIDGERTVAVSFVTMHNNEHSLPEEAWRNAIVLTTLLFGGFESTDQIYDYFRNEFDTENTVRQPIALPAEIPEALLLHRHPFARDEIALWERTVNGIHCQILIERGLSTQQEYLASIRLVSDTDVFGINSWVQPDAPN